MSCTFCQLDSNDWVSESDYFYAVWDIDPIQSGHLLVISKRHAMSLQELTASERQDLLVFQSRLIDSLEQGAAILGVTIATNNGHLMDPGLHFHSHLIPRYKDDGFWDGVLPIQHDIDLNGIVF